MPPPAVMRDFAMLVPDAPERIFRQFEEEGDHRRRMEMREIALIGRGQVFAGLFALAIIVLTAYAIFQGAYALAGTLAATTIVGGILAFLGTKRRKEAA